HKPSLACPSSVASLAQNSPVPVMCQPSVFGREPSALEALNRDARASVLLYQYPIITTQYTPPGWLALVAKQAPSEYPEDSGCDNNAVASLGSSAGAAVVQAVAA